MIQFLVRRILWGAVVIWAVASAVFFLTMSIPSDPARMIVGPHASKETVEQVRHNLGLDRPLAVQYRLFWERLVGIQRDDAGRVHLGWPSLGRSYQRQSEVITDIRQRFNKTAWLAVGAILVQLFIGIPVGIVSAARKGALSDQAGMVGALVGISAPTFWLGTMLLYLLAFRLPVFPLGGFGETFFAHFGHLVLPSLTLGLTGAAYYSRVLRSEMLDVLGQDYVRTALSKGLTQQTVVLRHVLRNSLIPVVTLLGLDVGVLMGGAIVTESIFSLNGVGKLAIDAIFNVDVPVIMGTVLFASVLMVAANLVVDMVYAVLDPRIRLS